MEKDSFASALKRAREIASKIKGVTGSSDPVSRSFANNQLATLDAKKSLAQQIADNLSQKIQIEVKFSEIEVDEEGNATLQAMIPAVLVGVVIGKNCENLQGLQERAEVKMHMAVEDPSQQHSERALIIEGEKTKVELAKAIVEEYVKDKHQLLGLNTYNMQLSLGIEYDELEVPKEAVGMVIGKQGETIKRVNNETGCLVKFKPPVLTDDDRVRICTFQGSIPQIQKAKAQIKDIVETLKRKYGLTKPVPEAGQEVEEIKVSAARAGVVIGKGGENIRQINALSCAQVCIDRSTPDNSEYRVFFIVGTRQQIEHAKFLIREKSGEAGSLPISAIMALNPNLGNPGFANNAPWLPSNGAPVYGAQANDDLPYAPNCPWDPQPTYGAPQDFYPTQNQSNIPPPTDSVAPNEGQPVYDQNQDYSAAWAAYYQMYQQQSANYTPSSTDDPQAATTQISFDPSAYADPEAYAAAYQAYCQQYYAQYPEYYQQWLDSQNQAKAQTSEAPVLETPTSNPQNFDPIPDQEQLLPPSIQDIDIKESIDEEQPVNSTKEEETVRIRDESDNEEKAEHHVSVEMEEREESPPPKQRRKSQRRSKR